MEPHETEQPPPARHRSKVTQRVVWCAETDKCGLMTTIVRAHCTTMQPSALTSEAVWEQYRKEKNRSGSERNGTTATYCLLHVLVHGLRYFPITPKNALLVCSCLRTGRLTYVKWHIKPAVVAIRAVCPHARLAHSLRFRGGGLQRPCRKRHNGGRGAFFLL
jgi:hypothetical protein